jgi:putative intracellular protease/amidase
MVYLFLADGFEVIEAMAPLDMLTRAGRVVVNPEMDVQYCLFIAHKATHRPLEFFNQLKARDVVRVKNKVRNSFFGGE